MKNILIISNEFPPLIGGAGMVARDVATALTRNNMAVTVVTKHMDSRKKTQEFNLIETIAIPKITPYFYWRKAKKCNLNKFDKIIINDVGAAMAAGLFFDRKLQSKCLVYLHGREPERLFLSKSFFNKVTNFTNKHVELLNNCQNIISVSEYMKERFLKYTRLNYLYSKILTVYNGIDKNIFYFSPVDLYKKYSIQTDNKLILSVSRIVKDKGYDDKYRIFKQLVLSGYKYHWIIVGDGDYLTTIKRNAARDGLLSNITFEGSVKREELKNFYSSVDVFWLLSNFEEALGLVYLEASACGVPVIARKKAGMREAVKHKVSGFLVEKDEEVLDILKKQKFLEIEKEQIESYIKKFQIDNTIKKLIQLI
jgi:glycosyltransferase involved in cell wall biosynthesis